MSTTVDTAQLSETIHGLKDAAGSALQNQSAEDFEAFERYLSEVEGYVREIQQSLWAGEARGTIRKLEKGEPLNDADQTLIRSFLVSDAQAYLRQENNFGDWVQQINDGGEDAVRCLGPANSQACRSRRQHRQRHSRHHAPQADPEMDK